MNGKAAGKNPDETPETADPVDGDAVTRDDTPAVDSTTPLPATKAEIKAEKKATKKAAKLESPRNRRRQARAATGDEFGPEPAWLQHGTAGRTFLGIVLVLAVVGATAGAGWFFFTPPAPAADSGDAPASSVCQTETHNDEATGVSPPKAVDNVPERQTATVETNFGSITVLLFGDVAQCGVANFGHLASQGFYQDSDCHRLTTQPSDPTATLRCGDPTGSGGGGPGYRFNAEQAYTDQPGRDYVALINNKSGKAGSAFAFIRGESKPTASLSVIGQVISGHTVLDQIGASAGMDDYDDVPPEPVVISDVTIEEGTATVPPSDESGQPGGEESLPEDEELPGDGEDLPSDLPSDDELPTGDGI